MSTYRELIYMVLDEVKLLSDDATFTENHVSYLLDKYRAYILNQKYSKSAKEASQSNYQTICLDLEKVNSIDELACSKSYLRSTIKVPSFMNISQPSVYAKELFGGTLVYVPQERFEYTSYTKYLNNIIYCTIADDNYLYIKSNNPQFLYLDKVRLSGVFEDASKAAELSCDASSENICDPMDAKFPLEEELITLVLQAVVKELIGASYRPKDNLNNANDDLASLANFIYNNIKSQLAKQLQNG